MKNNYIYVPGLSESVESELKTTKKEQAERIVTTTGAVKRKTTTQDRGVVRNKKVDERDIRIPVWEKYALTVKEAAEYYNVAESKLRDFVANSRDEPFVLKAGARLLVKRKLFEAYLDNCGTI